MQNNEFSIKGSEEELKKASEKAWLKITAFYNNELENVIKNIDACAGELHLVELFYNAIPPENRNYFPATRPLPVKQANFKSPNALDFSALYSGLKAYLWELIRDWLAFPENKEKFKTKTDRYEELKNECFSDIDQIIDSITPQNILFSVINNRLSEREKCCAELLTANLKRDKSIACKIVAKEDPLEEVIKYQEEVKVEHISYILHGFSTSLAQKEGYIYRVNVAPSNKSIADDSVKVTKSLIDDAINSGSLKCYKRYDINKCYTSDECYKVVKTRELALFIREKQSKDPTYPVPLPQWLEKYIKEEANNQEMPKNKCGECEILEKKVDKRKLAKSFGKAFFTKVQQYDAIMVENPLTYPLVIETFAYFAGIRICKGDTVYNPDAKEEIIGFSYDMVSRYLRENKINGREIFDSAKKGKLDPLTKRNHTELAQKLSNICIGDEFSKLKEDINKLKQPIPEFLQKILQ